MKRNGKFLSLLLALAMVCSLFAPALAEETAPAAAPEKIVILHTNDVHCEIDQSADKDSGAVTHMGYAAVAAYKAEMERTYGMANVTLVDAGDAIQGGPVGTLTKGAYLVDIMNKVGYDIAVPGNHEFDYGMDNFLSLAKDRAEYTYICSNFTDLRTNSGPTPVFDAYKVLTYGSVKVGYVGIDTPETFTKSTPTYFQDGNGNYIYSFSEANEGKDLYAAVQTAVDAAHADGADYVVAVGHLGTEGSADVWKSEAVIANTTGIDALIDGHSHESYEKTVSNKDGKDVVLAQTGTKLANIGKLIIDTKTGEISHEQISGYAAQDSVVADYIKGIHTEFDAILKEVVAKTSVALTTDDPASGLRAVRSAETNLGDLVADAYRTMMGADVSIINGGGIRASIKSGNITNGDLLSVQPYSNELCLVEVTGQDILDALEMGARSYPEENGGFQQVSGLTYTIDAAVESHVLLNDKGEFVKVDGNYRVTDVKVGGKDLDLKKTYTLASHNFMIKSGGDGFVMFKDNKLIEDCTRADNQAFIDYIVEKLDGVVGADYANPYGQGRVTVINDTAKAPNWYYTAAKAAVLNGMMTGVDRAGTFAPDGAVTRATVYQILFNMEGKPAEGAGKAAFNDIEGKWYSAAAHWAGFIGLAEGKADGSFGGDDVLTRAELAQIIADYADLKGVTVDTAGMAMREAPDYESIPAEYLDGMTFCYYGKIMTGNAAGELLPAGQLTRAQLAQVMYNFSLLEVPAEKAA